MVLASARLDAHGQCHDEVRKNERQNVKWPGDGRRYCHRYGENDKRVAEIDSLLADIQTREA